MIRVAPLLGSGAVFNTTQRFDSATDAR